jgi:hypothetical protein
MSELGHSRHFDGLSMTSGLPLEADIVTAGRHVSKVPNRRHLAATSLGRFVGVERAVER